MALYKISSGGSGAITSTIDSLDQFSKDPGANVSPQGAPNSTVTGTVAGKALTYNGVAGSQVLFVLNNPG